MPCQLPTDCLSEIFEYLEEDKIILHSCLFVSRLWCKISVRILWRNIWKFTYHCAFHQQLKVRTAVLSTLIACLPNESIALLYRNKIFISTPTSKPPLFNYSAFCNVLSIGMINLIIDDVLIHQCRSTLVTSNLKDLVSKEIFTMFMNQIYSLKKLVCFPHRSSALKDYYSGTRDCLTDLSELCCGSNIHSEFFFQLSQICHNLQSLTIKFDDKDGKVSNGLRELITSQNNLKNLNLFAYYVNNWKSIISVLTKHSNTLRKLHIYSYESLPLSFVALLSNLQEIKCSATNLEILQNVTFPKFKILKIPYDYGCPKHENFIKFLENNGIYLTELYIKQINNILGLHIAKFCPNLKKLSEGSNNYKLDTLKTIFNSCQYLESIKICCEESYYLNEREVLEAVAKHSPENFCELKIDSKTQSELISNLELFFINWKNRTSQKSLSLIILSYLTEENTKIIEKYRSLGIIKKFEIKRFNYEEIEEQEECHFGLSYIK